MRLLCIGALLFAMSCSHDHEGYSTFQDCYDDHTIEEGLSFQEAVVVCCIDHEIDGESGVCGATAADCVTYLDANLTSTATSADTQAACDEYETQKGQ